ncbi:MAG: ATP synthase F0 subunit C [Omnitrophica WOR_2 bacterium RIFCSPHIGHO2_01_FULL_48_9]|nr:MAG: ATP synthase F0 subunit C [Omnitrophica WOR_2 bacterium RIFCSPHIGHO2_02_FULL_48_11]OGX30253.1 MAG: ATP synthase F0 subunit C [Omnitrophica WOR_2 bacterium RIFCSPHIGHO2_01_FULL_48_9]
MEGIPLGLFAGVGAGLVTLGAGIGIGRLTASALDGVARQPEAVKDLQKLMILGAAFIEGVAFLGLVICLLGFFLK